MFSMPMSCGKSTTLLRYNTRQGPHMVWLVPAAPAERAENRRDGLGR